MLDRKVIIGAIESHCRTLTDHDKEGWLRIWADEATLEDPVGVDTFRGIGALRTTFWELVELTSPLRLGLLDEIIVCGEEAIAILSAESSWGGTQRNVGPLVDHFTFGPDGKITAMRAHWNFAKHGYRPEMAPQVADRERMVAAVKTHCQASTEGNREVWVKIFANDVVIEDPVGSGAIYRGIEAVSATFWDRSQGAKPRLQLTEEVIVSGKEAVAILSAEVGPESARRKLAPIVDHFTFNEDGKVASMRAFFNY
jgi:steroid Delta-isomerase